MHTFTEAHRRASRALRLSERARRLGKWASHKRAERLLAHWQDAHAGIRGDLNRQRNVLGLPPVFAPPTPTPYAAPMTDADIPF